MKLRDFKELVRKLPKVWDELEVRMEVDAGHAKVGTVEVQSYIDESVVIILPTTK